MKKKSINRAVVMLIIEVPIRFCKILGIFALLRVNTAVKNRSCEIGSAYEF